MSKKLLLADDSVTIQKVIEITFANEDYDLTIVGNGDEALEKAQGNPPDLIMADIIMPGKNGYELCSEIKKIPALAQTPVLLLAGSFEPFDEEKARSVGANSWIAKPFESQSLIEKVKDLLENPPQSVQAPAMPPVPSLEEKEASLEGVIPLETPAPLEAVSSVAEVSAEETGASVEENLAVGEEESISEPVIGEPEESVSMEPVPDIMGSSPVESEESTEVQDPMEVEAPSVGIEADTEAAFPEMEPAPAEPARVELEEPAEVEASMETEESFVGFEADSEAASPEVEPASAEPARVELEEPAEVEASMETEEPFVTSEVDTVEEITMPEMEPVPEEPASVEMESPAAIQTPVETMEAHPDKEELAASAPPAVGEPALVSSVSESADLPPLEVEEDDEEEILLLDENDILVEDDTVVVEDDTVVEDVAVVEDEIVDEEDLAIESEVLNEEAAPEAEDFFESLPESSFDLKPEEEEEEESGLVLHRPLGSFSLDEIDEESPSIEEEPSSDTPAMTEGSEETESDGEFSFDDFDEGLPEEEDVSFEPDEPVAEEPPVPLRAVEAPSPASSYAQMEQKVHSLTDAQLHAIVEKVAGATIERIAREILEQVAWEVVPDLSENMIKEEIQKIKAAQ